MACVTTVGIAICDNPPWFGRDHQCDAYNRALERAAALGWDLRSTNFSLLFELSSFLYDGPWVAEHFAAIKDFIEQPDVEIDPTVRSIIQKSSQFSAIDLFTAEYARADLTRAIEDQFQHYDAILVPTTPTFPTIEQVRQDPILENSRLGTHTNFVNFLDWSAISVPAGLRSDGLPFGITIISTRWQEEKLCRLAMQLLSSTPRKLGSTAYEYHDSPPKVLKAPTSTSQLVVVGAHLSGFPLNYQLTECGATFNRTTATAPSYCLYELPSTNGIRKPGLKRIADNTTPGSSIEVRSGIFLTRALEDS
jgi:urea carboxylase/allophanate hydrolase